MEAHYDADLVAELSKVVKYEPAKEHRLSFIDKVEVNWQPQNDTVLMVLILSGEKTGRVGYILPFIAGCAPAAYSHVFFNYIDQHEQFRLRRKDRRLIDKEVKKAAAKIADELADFIIEWNLVKWYGTNSQDEEYGWVSTYVLRGTLDKEARQDLLEEIKMCLDDRGKLTDQLMEALDRILA